MVVKKKLKNPPPVSTQFIIGNKIKEIFLQKGMSKSEFSRKIKTSRENVYGIFKRKTIDTLLLMKISRALNHNFFMYYNTLFSRETIFPDTNQNINQNENL